MTDIVITAADVVAGSGATRATATAGESITQGEFVYQESDGLYMLADADGASATVRTPIGVALNAAENGQPVTIQTSGQLTIGGTLTAGTAYYLSGTPGAMCPLADVTGGDYIVLVGLALSTTILELNIRNTGVATAP